MAESHHDKPGVLRNIRVKRVALVDQGANFDLKTGDGAHIMLFKSAPSVGSVHVPVPAGDDDCETEYEKANLSAESRNSLPDSAFAAVWIDDKGKKRRKLPIHDAGHFTAARGRIDQADIPANVKAAARRKIEAASRHKEKSVKKSMLKSFLGLFAEPDVEKRNTAAAALAVELEKADDNDADDMHKADCKCEKCMVKHAPAVPDVVTKALADIEKRNLELAKLNTDLASKLQVEIEKRLDAEMVDVLKQFKHSSVDLTKDVVVFRKMKSDSPEAFDRTIAIMKAQDAQLAHASLYADIGTRRGTGEGSAWAQIEAKADSIMEKSADLTREQAIEKAMERNPQLVRQYRQETQSQ